MNVLTTTAANIEAGNQISVGRLGLHTVESVAIQGRTVVVRCSKNTTWNTKAFRTFTFPISSRVRVYA